MKAPNPNTVWATPARGPFRIDITIAGSRVWIGCRAGAVRVVIQRGRRPPQVETDLVERVEVET